MAERRKLIEVALPLEAINRESAREKSIRHGHPSTLHLWWARRPLAACRAVLFASIVDDPSSHPEEFPTEDDQERERQRLFGLIEELVKWENTTNETVVEAARAEIRKATGGDPPPVLDPFCGGGSIPLEAQRLGLEAHASDLNPVAVLITKALVQIPPMFAGQTPVNPNARARIGRDSLWSGAAGLTEDVRYYGLWMRDEAVRRIGHLYPTATLSDGRAATVVAWLWGRTVRCPNPACGAEMPLVRSFDLATAPGKERHLRPEVDSQARRVRFRVEHGKSQQPGTVDRGGARCLVCGEVAPLAYIRNMSGERGLRKQLLALVAQSDRARVYLDPDIEHENRADAEPAWGPEELVTTPSHDVDRLPMYGMRRWRDAFTSRQLATLATFSELIPAVRDRVLHDAGGASAYADAVVTYLGLCTSKLCDYNSSLVVWSPGRDQAKSTFARQALAMVWDFAEVNPFAEGAGDFSVTLKGVTDVLSRLPGNAETVVEQLDAVQALPRVESAVVCTDPPYYDNIGYADLSDFFYVWLRHSLSDVYPRLFSTLLTPKSQELIASPPRFDGDRNRAQQFFEDGLRQVFARLGAVESPDYPLTLFYAFKQAESQDGDVASTGWETMLTGLLDCGLSVTGTWPMRTERSGRSVSIGTAALASSVVLVCRPRPATATMATRREFAGALRRELPQALKQLQHGNIAPVDLAQAAIGPGMAIFSRYAKVVEADGSQMTVRTALGLINHALDEILSAQEGDFDADTRFAVTWFEQRGITEGPYGEADVLARAKNTSVAGMVEAGVLTSRAGKVSLLPRDELAEDWDPLTDRRLTAWEATQHLTRRLEIAGESGAADLLRRLGGDFGEQAKELAYRLYVICERKGWAQEALGYNALVVAWPEIARQVAGTPEAEAQQQLEV